MGSHGIKSRVSWSLTLAAVVLCAFQFYALWVLAATFAAGLVWWANFLLILGPLVAVAALVVSLRAPRQAVAAVLSALVILTYVAVWAPIVPQLTIKPGG